MPLMKSESIGALALALSKVQGNLEGAKKEITNTFLKNKYADLSSCWDAVRKELALNELAVVQSPMPASEGNSVHLMTTLLHSSGEWISSEITMPVEAQKGISMAQSYGIVMTYARRYALAAVLGITQEDDDGNGAAASGNTSTQRPAAPPTTPRPTNTPPAATAAPKPADLAKKLGYTGLKAYCDERDIDFDALRDSVELQKKLSDTLNADIYAMEHPFDTPTKEGE